MKPDLFNCLPSEMTINILSRLPVVTIIQCKCVCKPWLDLIETSEFAKSHLSNSVPGLVVFRDFHYGLDLWSKPYKFYEFVDEPGPENIGHRSSVVFNFNLPHHEHICSSVNGLLFLSDTKESPRDHFVCNPITRDYIKLPRPDGPPSSERKLQQGSFGFGVSKMSGQYKVVTIFHEIKRNQTKCQVYTIGTGSWRSIEPLPLKYAYDNEGRFVNGNLYWIVRNMYDDSLWLSCFDLETEQFDIWSLPPHLLGWDTSLAALEEGLIICDGLLVDEDDNVIWLMTEDGDDKYWTMKFVITSSNCYGVVRNGVLCPIKVFKDGNILLAQARASKLVYSMNPNTYDQNNSNMVDSYEYDRICAVSYVPSFLSLKTFTLENVSSF